MTLQLYPFAPFQQGVPTPVVDPDSTESGSQICVIYNDTWRAYILGALATLAARQTWLGTEAEITLAVKQSNLLLDMFMGDGCDMPQIFDLRQSGLVLQRQNTSGGAWTDLYDPRGYLVVRAPSNTYPNSILAPAGTAGLLLNSSGSRAATSDALLQIHAGIGAPAAIFYRDDNSTPVTATVLLQHNLSSGVQPGLDFLRAVDQAGNKLGGINAYGNPTTRRYTSLPTATVDQYGSLIMLNSGYAPDDGLYYCDYDAYTATYYWRQGIGPTGPTGGTGATGHGVDLLDPSLQAVLYPNQSPEIVVDNALPATTFLGFKLPRAVNFSLATTLVRKPNQDPTFAMSSDTHGDKTLQAGIPRAQKIVSFTAHNLDPGSEATVDYSEDENGDSLVDLGVPVGEPGGDSEFDNTPPPSGGNKTYSFQVPASGFHMPFVIPSGTVMKNAATKGLWLNQQYPFSELRKPSDGVFSGGTFPHYGDLIAIPDDGSGDTDGYYVYANDDAFNIFSGNHSFDRDTRLMFKQHAQAIIDPDTGLPYGGNAGLGYLMLEFVLSRPGVIGLTYILGSSGPSSVPSGEEFNLTLGDQGGGFWNSEVTFSVPVILELISVTGWSQGIYSGATWAYVKGNGTDGGYYPAPVAVPLESALKYGVNSGSACTVRLRATIA